MQPRHDPIVTKFSNIFKMCIIMFGTTEEISCFFLYDTLFCIIVVAKLMKICGFDLWF